jgi:hypothetical protein
VRLIDDALQHLHRLAQSGIGHAARSPLPEPQIIAQRRHAARILRGLKTIEGLLVEAARV